MAKQIRPLIGLTEVQAQANANYREKVYRTYIDNGMTNFTAAAKADKAALRYAGKQHRERAETIVQTELAFAYNRGAHMGVSQAISDRLMGRCEMVWTTTGTNRVCGRCLALKDTVVGHTDESGVTLPPLHPRCRCAIIYNEVGDKPRPTAKPSFAPISPLIPAEAAVATEIISPPPKPTNKPPSNIGDTMSTENYVPKWPPRDKSRVIPKEKYNELRELAETGGISLIGVKKFDGSVEVIKEIIETLTDLIKKFPAVIDRRHKLELELSILLDAKDYAETNGRKIKLNAAAYRNVNLLQAEYQKDVEKGWFVQGTDYRAIPHHEFGHVVANTYKLDPLKIACEITGLKSKATLDYLDDVLSKYAGLFESGGEIISEVFADMSTGSPCEFSRKFYDKVLKLTRGDKNDNV